MDSDQITIIGPKEPPVVCSQCFDDIAGVVGFDAILPQSTCAKCGRACLGYRLMPNAFLLNQPIYPSWD